MAEVTRCPTCGNVLSGDLGGRCPECMLQAGLASAGGPSGPATIDYHMFAPAGQPGKLPRAGEEFGGYHLVRALGQGGMGTVFEAEERATGRRLALKVLSHALDSPSARQRFLREGRLAASVNHPHSVYVFGTEEIDGAPVITMELVQGGTLQDRVRSHGPLPISDAVDAILHVVDGLAAAHAVGVLHRDVKPSNCFLDAEGRVKIGDFGLSIARVGRNAMQITSSGVILGTPAFASPEQLRGDELDHRSDQYALGVTLFYLLTGKLPFDAEQMVQLVATVLEKPAPDVRTLRPDVPRELALVVRRCLEKEAAHRHRDYAQLRSALLPFSSLVPTPATPALRVIAGLIDVGVLVLVQRALDLFLIALGHAPTLASGLGRQLFEIALGVTVWFLYFALPEGLQGASLGKWLLGLRVAGAGTMQPPGLARAAVRTLVYYLLPSLPAWIYVAWHPTFFVDMEGALLDLSDLREGTPVLVGLATLTMWALLLLTMRRSNGFATVHDLVSGTRVIVRPRMSPRPVTTLAALAEDAVQPGRAMVGPYHLLAPLGAQEGVEWHLAYDARLLRKVWVRIVRVGTAPLPALIRNQARAGRLRWLTGRRGADENWDAFEAPGGQALWNLLDRPRDWGEVRFWLLDLSEELSLALREGSVPAELGLERVWITAEGRAKLLDLPAPGLDPRPTASAPSGPGDVASLRGFLRQVAASGLRGQRLDFAAAQNETFAFPLPLHARAILEDLTTVQRPEVVQAEIARTLDRPARLSTARRCGPIAAWMAVLGSLVTLGVADHYQSSLGLAEHPDAADLRTYLFEHTPPLGIGPPAAGEDRERLERLIAAQFGERIQDPAFWSNTYVATKIQPTHEQIARDIVARQPKRTMAHLANKVDRDPQTVTDTLKEMRQRLDELEKRVKEKQAALPAVPVETRVKAGRTEPSSPDAKESLRSVEVTGQDSPLAQSALLLGSFMFVLALLSLVSVVALRGGLMWHVFGIAAVTADGQPASRVRLAARSAVAWTPFLVAAYALFLFGLTWEIDTPGDPRILLAVIGVALVLGSASAVTSRSWADRLTGTWLVPR